ncbi:hypothetical protein DSY0871 [Desulfitobacterium hafniense Y51]|uniref:PucR C-terminal helix-turn-helix domain-containing protein n=1 Tax=Desulfitobacterium hafniense (strain Y51) TaxID=138119 RepID=Q24Z82_DESHY|nr:hypothetical protein DSY0871 [Desulfitobacterium hafniense Y51]
MARYLSKYDVHSIIKNESISDIIDYKYLEPGQNEFRHEYLYVVNNDEIDDWFVLQNEANFLLMQEHGTQIYDYLGKNTNVIIVPAPVNQCALFKSVRDCCLAIETLKQYSGAFLKAIINKDSLEVFMDLTSKILGNPVALLDSKFQPIAASKPEKTDDIIWDTIVNEDSSSELPSELSEWTNMYLADIMNGMTYPIIYHYKSLKTRLIAGVPINGQCRYIFQAIEHRRSFRESDLPLSACITAILGNALESVHSSRRTEKRLVSFFDEIVTGKEENKNNILQKANSIGLTLRKQNYMLIIFSEKKDALYEDVIDLFPEVCKKIPGKAFIYEFKIIVILSGDSTAYDPITQIKPFLESKIIDGWKSCISFTFPSPCDLKNAYLQCLAAATFGCSLQSRNMIFDYKDYMGYHLLSKAATYFNTTDFCLPLAREIMKFDIAHNTQYAKTLHHYLRNHKNINIVSKNLHLHRNTVVYRLERLKELFGLDLDDFATMNNLALSFDIITCSDPKYSFL